MAEIFTFHSDNERSVKIVGRVTFVQSEGLANYFLNGQVKEKCQVFLIWLIVKVWIVHLWGLLFKLVYL